MKSGAFEYHRPETLDDALGLLSELGDEAKILAGGQSLLPMMALRLARPAHLVDIGALTELDTLDAGEDGVRIGALVRHARAERSDVVRQNAPLVAEALPHVGHRPIRTRGTVVGSIAHADPAAEMPAVCLAVDATMIAMSSTGTREIPASEFFEGHLTTALRDDELLAAVRFPRWPATRAGAVVEVSRRHGDYALVGLACSIEVEHGAITAAALSFLGVASTPLRVETAERSLVGSPPTPDVFAAAAQLVSATLEPSSDIHASAAYRRHVAGVLTTRGLTEATSKIGALA